MEMYVYVFKCDFNNNSRHTLSIHLKLKSKYNNFHRKKNSLKMWSAKERPWFVRRRCIKSHLYTTVDSRKITKRITLTDSNLSTWWLVAESPTCICLALLDPNGSEDGHVDDCIASFNNIPVENWQRKQMRVQYILSESCEIYIYIYMLYFAVYQSSLYIISFPPSCFSSVCSFFRNNSEGEGWV